MTILKLSGYNSSFFSSLNSLLGTLIEVTTIHLSSSPHHPPPPSNPPSPNHDGRGRVYLPPSPSPLSPARRGLRDLRHARRQNSRDSGPERSPWAPHPLEVGGLISLRRSGLMQVLITQNLLSRKIRTSFSIGRKQTIF